jgi:hypothetical protein
MLALGVADSSSGKNYSLPEIKAKLCPSAAQVDF